jgi:hypothetical protein
LRLFGTNGGVKFEAVKTEIVRGMCGQSPL